MLMTLIEYVGIEMRAGGFRATPRQFVRAARARLPDRLKTRAVRCWRHAWLREGLAMLAETHRQIESLYAEED